MSILSIRTRLALRDRGSGNKKYIYRVRVTVTKCLRMLQISDRKKEQIDHYIRKPGSRTKHNFFVSEEATISHRNRIQNLHSGNANCLAQKCKQLNTHTHTHKRRHLQNCSCFVFRSNARLPLFFFNFACLLLFLVFQLQDCPYFIAKLPQSYNKKTKNRDKHAKLKKLGVNV